MLNVKELLEGSVCDSSKNEYFHWPSLLSTASSSTGAVRDVGTGFSGEISRGGDRIWGEPWRAFRGVSSHSLSWLELLTGKHNTPTSHLCLLTLALLAGTVDWNTPYTHITFMSPHSRSPGWNCWLQHTIHPHHIYCWNHLNNCTLNTFDM